MECVDNITFLGFLGWLHSMKEVALTAVKCVIQSIPQLGTPIEHFVCTAYVSACVYFPPPKQGNDLIVPIGYNLY